MLLQLLCHQMIVMVTLQSRCVKLYLLLTLHAWPQAQHVHACGTCMLAAPAYLQHLHCCSMCMMAASACAWWQHMHLHWCCKCICAANACVRHFVHFARLAWLWPVAACALICHPGEAASLRSQPRLVHCKPCILQDLHGYGQLQHVH